MTNSCCSKCVTISRIVPEDGDISACLDSSCSCHKDTSKEIGRLKSGFCKMEEHSKCRWLDCVCACHEDTSREATDEEVQEALKNSGGFTGIIGDADTSSQWDEIEAALNLLVPPNMDVLTPDMDSRSGKERLRDAIQSLLEKERATFRTEVREKISKIRAAQGFGTADTEKKKLHNARALGYNEAIQDIISALTQ